MKNKKVLEIALAKLRPFLDTKQWHAVLSYSEIIALYENGYKESNRGFSSVEWAKQQLEKGHSGSTSISFIKIGKNKPHYNRPNKDVRPFYT